MSHCESLTRTLSAASCFVANGINNWLPTLYETVYHLPLQEALPLASITSPP
ncbi:hypothetical protein [Acidovorax sp. SUPP3334]|uniref:hypothetical protein n=1 Tax=Acidovorax sp. SUPP3334 TaxID=2920881 RepID=UPI0023DE5B9E|nr:hypothetical protein [Acidovorax sp. SUPP3334]GKT27129.1 hypothetical protein AVHM3334_22845 [Acidovorax sp. SUPP3334]